MQGHSERAIRPAAVAGLFYPSDPLALRSTVSGLLANAGAEHEAGPHLNACSNAPDQVAGLNQAGMPLPKALIAPHAGYAYSGPVAASAYRMLAKARGKISRVILLGPSHRFAFTGMAGPFARAYETPLGVVPVDQRWLDRARNVLPFGLSNEAHEGEHCLETQLPFLQLMLGDFSLVPVICGRVSGDEVADLLEALWGGPETLIVVSSDLSHYLDYETCRRADAKTCAAIERLDPIPLAPEQACGAAPVNGLVAAARRKGMSVKTLDLRNSGDAAGPRDRVVGYGAWAFWEKEAVADDDDDMVRRHGRLMNDMARRAICGRGPARPEEKLPAAFNRPGACFVTLHKAGNLRGCCGSILAKRPLVEDINANALRSAYGDPRFTPLQQVEWAETSLSVTLLSALQPMSFANEAELLANLRPLEDGLLIEDAGRHAIFLPAVWKVLPEKQEFLAHLKAKAGLSRGHWSSNFRASRFSVKQAMEEELRLATFWGEIQVA